ncbi:hypothetical protein AKJ56_00590 [candidate division MSBL1 archaeon SCGC-AAA382N08]|uniref:Metallo-beta-lactamase domain-containing protein n=1 Tax=candidate division MSBL1 archaeon SCGC-AAA382N08 TaxID=1698285 RepID=A0A133VQK0_9EURY|nr:hypothetical protein AKJ56_00590 [candidate division MSBL1 archaeon SCGC-AAA382N08]
MKNLTVTNLSEGLRSFTSNVYLIKGKVDVLIDAGNDENILEKLREETDDLAKVLITHSHPDHIGLAEEIKEEFNASIHAWDSSKDWVDERFTDGQNISVGDSVLKAIHTPGHSPNHVVFYGEGALFSGDLIFPGGSFGRTDLPGGDQRELVKSIRKIEKEYGPKVNKLYPGHMQPVTENAYKSIKESLEMVERF